MTELDGVYRYIPLHELIWRLWQGWTWAADLGPRHSEYAVLMKWCCGKGCNDSEIP